MPQEIWVVKINATASRHVPVNPGDIGDRRNALIGNVSLFQQVDSLSVLNDLHMRGAFKPGFAESLNRDGPIRIPCCYPSDEPRSYHIPFIEMSAAVSDRLDDDNKLDRSTGRIEP